MAQPSIVAVTQRIDYIPDRGEYRDAVDQRLFDWLRHCGYLPVALSNTFGNTSDRTLLDAWLEKISPAAIVLSGGNDIGQFPARDATEHYLLDWCSDRSTPVLGICRGMQMMAVWAGAELAAAKGHVATRHELKLSASECESAWPRTVNSYHDWTLLESPQGFDMAAQAEDGSIEAIRHRDLPWEGWMWHPERESEFSQSDTQRIRNLFGE